MGIFLKKQNVDLKDHNMMVKIKYKAVLVNMPDYQGRIYKREPERIRWDRRLHEKLEGHNAFVTLPPDTDLALYHDKTIETQLKTNIRYNEWFSAEENRGHNVFDKKSDGK